MPPSRTRRVRLGTTRIPRRAFCTALRLALAGAFVALVATPAHATRPFRVTESAVALQPGGVLLEEGLSRERWGNGVRVYALTSELSYSLYANLDLEAEVPWVVAGGGGGSFDDGLGDIRTKAKINFLKERAASPLTVSGLIGVKFPTGTDQVSSDEVDVQLAALASKSIGPAAVHGNLSYTFVGGSSGRSTDDVLGLSVGVEAKTPVDGLSGVGEFIWEQARIPGRDDRLEVMGGAVYRIGPRVTVDASLSIGFGSGQPPYEGAPDSTLMAGLTWDVGRL